MRLSSNISQVNQNITGNVDLKDTSSTEQGLRNGMEVIQGKSPGQSITGEVILRDGSDILLELGKNQLLQAKLEGGMAPQPGQLLSFQIKNSSSTKVVLTPLFENLSQDPNVSKALQAAGLPENSITAGMVKAMMQEGLPIDRQSLYQMNRYINANPQVDIQTLVQMQRLSLPVTPENIAQFEAYKNYQHQMSESLTDIVDAFTQTFQEITGSRSQQEGINFYKEILGILTEELTLAEGEEKGQAVDSGGANSNSAIAEGLGKGVDQEIFLPQNEKDALIEQLKKAGVPDKLTNALENGSMGRKEFLGEIGKLLSEDTFPAKEALFKLLEGKEFKHLLKGEMSKQWMIQPEEVAKERTVDKFYEKLNSQMNRINELLTQSGRTATPLGKAVSNVTGNIDFMNQLNQMFTYVQLPLKMQSQNANGELFVYTNKKSLAKKDGNVSALLHLDMDHLGSMDVYVALNNQKVSTKFYMADDSALDLIAQNINILNERLESRGYLMSAEFVNRDEKTNVMDEILKQDKNISVLAGYSFDARA